MTPREEILNAAERAYEAMLRQQTPFRHSVDGQLVLCVLRDTVAYWRNQSAENVQDEFEARTYDTRLPTASPHPLPL